MKKKKNIIKILNIIVNLYKNTIKFVFFKEKKNIIKILNIIVNLYKNTIKFVFFKEMSMY
jgi:hypothetical protein